MTTFGVDWLDRDNTDTLADLIVDLLQIEDPEDGGVMVEPPDRGRGRMGRVSLRADVAAALVELTRRNRK